MVRPDGLVKVLDFGIAKLSPPRDSLGQHDAGAITETSAGVVVGTVQYMSPEQLRALEVDYRTDIFSLGLVIYELVVGRRPFIAETPTDEFVAVLEKDAPPLEASQELDRIVRKALAKDRESRYQSATELQADLRHLMRRSEVDAPQTISCPVCARDNPVPFGFCGTCGTALKRSCPGCQKKIPATTDVCNYCGHKLSESRGSIAAETVSTTSAASSSGERRRATIIFSTISGCSAILERLEPVEADRLIASIKDSVTEVITRFGGVVDRCSGEELVALFGIPASYEDDLLRAVQAALELHTLLRELGVDVEGRIGQRLSAYTGISSGAVVARLKEPGKYSVSGDTVRIAARLAAHAEAEEIVVSSEAQRLIHPYFKLEAKSALSLRPQSAPEVIYRVAGETGIQTRLEASVNLGLTRYTGRDVELAALKSCFEKALKGEDQFVTVLGDAGIGKSRLLLEFRRRLIPGSANIIETRCQTHGSTTPYLPFIELLRVLLGVRKEETVDRAFVAGAIRSIDSGLESYIPVYLHLLSIESPDDCAIGDLKGDDLRLAIQEALSAILTLHVKSGPGLILLEDWHWADEASDEILKQLADLFEARQLMIVATCRPERWLDWSYIGKHTVINLTPLNESSSMNIIQSITGAKELPAGLGDLLYKRTGGNPFFIEELCRTLLDDGTVSVVDGVARLEESITELNLPDSVQAVIRTRLDRLDAESQSLLRHASVLGREFNLSVLQRMPLTSINVPTCLENLQKHGLIQRARILPELAYRFRHMLTQEVAYDSLLLHQRKTLHEMAGAAIEDLYRERLEEQIELLTFHYSRAENWSKAIRFGSESAEKARGLSRFAEALSLLEQTEAWCSKLESGADQKRMLLNILLAQERLCETLGMRDRQQQLIDRILAQLDPVIDQTFLAEALVRQGELCTLLGRFDQAESALARALTIRRELADSIGERVVLRNKGFLHWQQGRYEDAVSCNKTALAIDLEHNDSVGYAKDLTNLASILRSQGKPKEALEYVKESLKVNEAIARPFSQGYTLTVAANIHRDLGDSEQAKAHYQRGIELTIQHRLPLYQIIIASAMASLCWERCEFEEALQLSNDLIALTRRLNLRRELAKALAVLSQRLLELDRLQDALPPLREAAQIFSELGDKAEQDRTLTSIAYVCERCRSDADATLTAWDDVRSLRAEQGNMEGELEALEGMARVARNQLCDLSSAIEYFSRGLDVARRIGNSAKQGDLLNTLGIIEWSRQNYREAFEYYHSALEIFQNLGDIVHSGLISNSLGVTLHKLGRRKRAASMLQGALDLHRASGQRLLEGHALAALADIFFEEMSLDLANEHYRASLEIRREIGDRKGEGWLSHHLARLFFLQADEQQGQARLTEALAIASEIGDRQLAEACASLRNDRRNNNAALYH